jgi:DNA-binding NtrC family response regulator
MEKMGLTSLLGHSPAMNEVREFVVKAARVRAPVLLLGETGTGKSLVGKVIHHESPRRKGAFQAVNCAGIPESLFESEFFGHNRGAFTGAREARRGILEQASGGTLFLDEIGELTAGQQAKLLTALEEGEIRRLGGEGTMKIDFRVLAATGRNLEEGMKSGAFRRDLYHRLSLLMCTILPLRERKEDIPILARRFLRVHQRRHGLPAEPLPADALAFLQAEPWPGNVRELSHLLEAALILSEPGPMTERQLRRVRARSNALQGEEPGAGHVVEGRASERYAFLGSPEEERAHILDALRRCDGNKSRAARKLGMSRNTLRSRLRQWAKEQESPGSDRC